MVGKVHVSEVPVDEDGTEGGIVVSPDLTTEPQDCVSSSTTLWR